MEKYYEELNKIFLKNEYNNLNGAINESKLLHLYCYYHYFNGDEDNIYDVCETCKFTKENNNYEYAYIEDENSEDKTIDILSVFYVDEFHKFEMKKIKYVLGEIENSLNQIKNGVYTIKNSNSKLLDMWDRESDTILYVKMLTNYIPESEEEKESYIEELANYIPRLEHLKFGIIFGDDIKQEIDSVSSPREYVDNGVLILEKKNNYLTYGNEDSLITNIMASSLKENYEKYSKSGLFSMNLRLYVKNAKVDEGIADSIKNKGEEFWYFNNGIIIICDDYKIKGNKLYLKNFSIVNGGQTTRMIGVTDFEKDFVVSCKVIKNKYDNSVDKITFVADIAAASNTQKPIKSTDIIANKVEQRMLKSQLNDAGIFLQIKRGEVAPPKEKYPEPWQKTKNDELAQYIFSVIYQRPGVARNNKDSLYSNKEKYNMIFGKTYSNDLIKNMLFIKGYYKKWLKILDDTDTNIDENITNILKTKKGLAKNGLLFTAAMIGIIAKFYYSPELMELYLNDSEQERFEYVKNNLTFNHAMFSKDFKGMKDGMFSIFKYVMDEYFYPSFMMAREYKPELAYSNFTKNDSSYYSVVKYIIRDLERGFPTKLTNIINEYFYRETDDDYNETRRLTNVLVVGFDDYKESANFKKTTSTPQDKDLENELTEYRTKTYKKRKIRAYKIFKDIERKSIVEKRPTTLEELKACFTNEVAFKLNNFGEDIIQIVIKNNKDNGLN